MPSILLKEGDLTKNIYQEKRYIAYTYHTLCLESIEVIVNKYFKLLKHSLKYSTNGTVKRTSKSELVF